MYTTTLSSSFRPTPDDEATDFKFRAWSVAGVLSMFSFGFRLITLLL
ncbi:hypothetical protein [Hydrogenophaga sp.]|nr:hypothetical protein [Hydrogenophaga sp.]